MTDLETLQPAKRVQTIRERLSIALAHIDELARMARKSEPGWPGRHEYTIALEQAEYRLQKALAIARKMKPADTAMRGEYGE